jgi:hypothetical protein
MRQIALVLFGCTTIAGCTHAPSIVGKWNGTLGAQAPTYEFKDDKTMKMDTQIGQVKASVDGTYETTDKEITIHLTGAKVGGKSLPITPAGQPGKGVTGAYKFNNANELALTLSGKTELLKRVPEGG